MTAKNIDRELNKRLEEEIKRRKVLQSENLDLYRKLEKRWKTDCKSRYMSRTYEGQVHHSCEASKKQISRVPCNNI